MLYSPLFPSIVSTFPSFFLSLLLYILSKICNRIAGLMYNAYLNNIAWSMAEMEMREIHGEGEIDSDELHKRAEIATHRISARLHIFFIK